ncbi:hypothetical protein D3C79_474770 [compost metagenome]
MVQMQRQRQVMALGCRAANSHQIVGTRIAKGARGPGHDHRGLQFGGGFCHYLHRFKIVYVERWHGIALPLCFQQHFTVGYQVHNGSLQLGSRVGINGHAFYHAVDFPGWARVIRRQAARQRAFKRQHLGEQQIGE